MHPKRIATATVGRQPSSIVVRHVYTTTGQSNPGTISIISTTQQQQQQQNQPSQQPQPRIITAAEAAELQHAQIISVPGPAGGGNAPGTAGGSFGGKYVLVQRAHIGDIVTPRAASAPPTQNQVTIIPTETPPRDINLDLLAELLSLSLSLRPIFCHIILIIPFVITNPFRNHTSSPH